MPSDAAYNLTSSSRYTCIKGASCVEYVNWDAPNNFSTVSNNSLNFYYNCKLITLLWVRQCILHIKFL
jgi:hypothetical protein